MPLAFVQSHGVYWISDVVLLAAVLWLLPSWMKVRREARLSLAAVSRLTWQDTLTALPNRQQYMERLDQEIRTARHADSSVALLLLDIDRFKLFNDSLGHDVGDQLLQEVAHRLKTCVRPQDLVARIGGDEFAVTLTGSSVEASRKVAMRVLELMKLPVALDGQEFRVTVSIGIALFPQDGEHSKSIMRSADLAMYKAKEMGKDRFSFYVPESASSLDERLFIENSLQRGLARGEFRVFYQPQIDIADGSILGMEALVRWQHPERGLLSPTQFIGVAEDTGLIVPLGQYVLRTACQQNAAWQRAGIGPFRVAVNLSLLQFRQHDLVEMIESILQETGLAPESLELEITESMAMLNLHYIMEKLLALKELGVHISIDDFGTGYSSLGYLKRFPVDTLKIDQSFVRDITHDVDGAAIVTAVIAIARSLGIDVVAEGVELREQLDFLQRNACSKVQGYFFSPPVPPEDLTTLLPGLRETAVAAMGARPYREGWLT